MSMRESTKDVFAKDRPVMKPKVRLLNSSSRLYDTVVHFKLGL